MKKHLLRRLILIVIMALAATIFWLFGLDCYLTLAFFKGSLEDFRAI